MGLPAAVRRFLDRQRVGHLATADRSGRPHVVPITYAVRGGTLYFALDRKPKRAAPHRLRRVRNITANPRVAVVVDRYSEDWDALEYVLLEGTARLLAGGRDHRRAIQALRRRYPQYRTMDLHDRPVVAVTIARAVHWTARRPR